MFMVIIITCEFTCVKISGFDFFLNSFRLDLCPMQCFGFSSDAPLCFQELPCAGEICYVNLL